jgi:PAS domain S-box-containing protein
MMSSKSSTSTPAVPSREPRRWSVRSHLIALVAGALLPLLGFSVLMVTRSARQEFGALASGLRGASRALALGVDRELGRSVAALQLLASSDHLNDDNIEGFYTEALRARESQGWWTVWLMRPDGAHVMNLLRPLGESLASLGDREYLQDVVTTRAPAVSNLYAGRISGKLLTAVAVPVVRDGELRYVLAAAVDAATLGRILHGPSLASEWVRSIVDRNGVFAARSRAPDMYVGQSASARYLEQTRRVADGFERGTTLDGREVYVAFSRSPFSGWTAAISVEAAALDGLIVRSVLLTVGGGLAILLVGLGLTFAVARRIQRAFQMSEDRLRLALEAADLGSWDLDPRTNVFEWSDQCKAFFGLPPGARVDYGTFMAGLHVEDRGRVHAIVQAALARETRGIEDAEFRVIGFADGLERWVLARGRALFDETGRPVRMIGTMQEVTVRARQEDERRRLAQEVESERTAILERERRAREDAETASRAKDDFLAVLSHELRTPLTSILGWARMLRAGKVRTEKVDDALDIIERNSRVQVRLINDLLDASRIVAGKMSLEQAPVDMATIATRAVLTVHADAAARSVRVEPSIDRAVGPVLGDATRLEQVVVNLLANAVKFTPGEGRVGISVRRVASRVRLVVSDTGEGIAAELLPRIFEPFRQAESTSRRRHDGLGLGLAIVHHLIERHGGTVRAESAGPGLGSTFTVDLPVMALQPETRGDEPPSAASRPPVGARVRLDGNHLLLVEDHADSRRMIRSVLESAGATVTDVESVADAVALLRAQSFDVLVSDLGMPGADGLDLIRLVRARERTRGGRLPAVALTAYAGVDDRERALAAGYDRYASKPVDPDELCDVVATAVGPAMSAV